MSEVLTLMIKLLQYLEIRALGIDSKTTDPIIQGINDSEQQLLLACQSTDRLAALRVFCRNHSYKHLEDKQGRLLIDYILPEPSLLTEKGEECLHIASAPIMDDPWDTYAEVYVIIQTGQTFDTSQEKTCADMRVYLDHRRACCKEYWSDY